MSASSPLPVSGLGAFRNITPGGVPIRPGDGAWAASTLGGVFYLATASPEHRSVLRYAPAAGKWETVFQKSLRAPKADREVSEAPLPEIAFLSGTSKAGEELYLRIVSGNATEYLRSSPTGDSFDEVPQSFEDVHRAFAAADEPVSNPNLPDHSPTSQLTHVLSLGGKTALCLADATLGCSVWSDLDGTGVKSVLVRGAHRFSLNSDILGQAVWQDSLFLALGSLKAPGVGKPPIGFEIVRLYPDGSWDLLVGTPRISNKGLKVPLACLGPGMNEFEPARLCFFDAGANHLLLGTFDDIAGFRIWRSTDGIEWASGEAELVGVDRVRGAQSLRVAGGTALVLDLDSPGHGATRAIWIGE